MGLKNKQEILSSIPQVEVLLKTKPIQDLISEHPQQVVTDAVRLVLSKTRRQILSQAIDWFPEETIRRDDLIHQIIQQTKASMKPSLHGVINGTGTILHTNLGRALLSASAGKQMLEVARRYSNLEMDEESGQRGLRYDHVSGLLCQLTGAEDAMVVNNNAAAVLLVLAALGSGKEVIISRGQLIEIGGAFRIPEVMEQSGCQLVEIGSTNKTHLTDYSKAITENTAMILKAHTSNYRIVGFTAEVDNCDLVELAKEHQIPLVEDLGSGILIDLASYGLPEPTVQGSIAAGIDVVTISGDKLLGGPQAGIILGKKEYLAKMKKHPLNRALRIDKLTLAALEATLKLYLDEKQALQEIPVLRMLTMSQEEVRKKADQLWMDVTMRMGPLANCQMKEVVSAVGGGSMPLAEIPSVALAVMPKHMSVNQLDEAMRHFDPPIFGRISKDLYLLDLRTIQDDEITRVADGLVEVLQKTKQV